MKPKASSLRTIKLTIAQPDQSEKKKNVKAQENTYK